MKSLFLIACLTGIIYYGVTLESGIGDAEVAHAQEAVSPFAYNGADDPRAFATQIQQLSSNKVLFVLIGASWCPNCHAERGYLQNIVRSGRNLAVLDLDYEKFPNIGKTFKRMEHIPENHIYYRSAEIANFMGAPPTENDLISFLQKSTAKRGISF